MVIKPRRDFHPKKNKKLWRGQAANYQESVWKFGNNCFLKCFFYFKTH